MTFRIAGRIAGLVVAASAVSACGAPLVDEQRTVATFSRIEVDGWAHLAVTIDEAATGSSVEVTVSAAEGEHAKVESVVDGETLVLRDKRHSGISFGGGGELRVSVTLPALAAISATDSASATIEGIAGGALDATAANFADITLSGAVDQLTLTAVDEAEVRARELTSQEVQVVATDFADVDVCATDLLDAQVTDEALIRFFCAPAQVEDDIRDRGALEPGT